MSFKTESKQFEYTFLVKESHLDTFGHVNNAEYLRLFEEARWDIIANRGYGIEKIKSSGMGPVLLEVNLKFKREIVLRETITIQTVIRRQKSKVFTIHQKMAGEKGELRAEALYTSAVFDTNKRKIIEPPQDWLSAVDML